MRSSPHASAPHRPHCSVLPSVVTSLLRLCSVLRLRVYKGDTNDQSSVKVYNCLPNACDGAGKCQKNRLNYSDNPLCGACLPNHSECTQFSLLGVVVCVRSLKHCVLWFGACRVWRLR